MRFKEGRGLSDVQRQVVFQSFGAAADQLT